MKNRVLGKNHIRIGAKCRKYTTLILLLRTHIAESRFINYETTKELEASKIRLVLADSWQALLDRRRRGNIRKIE